MRRSAVLVSAAAVCGLLVATLPVTSALGAPQRARPDVLTIKKKGGAAVKPGAILEGGLAKKTAAVFTVAKNEFISCTSVLFKDKVVKNPTEPGKSTEVLIEQTFKKGSCKATNVAGDPSNGVLSVTVAIPKKGLATSISDAKGDPVVVLGTTATIVIPSEVGTLSCAYAANKNTTKGNASNATESITFTAQPFHLVHSPDGCPPSGSFSAKFAPVKDTTVKGDPVVFIN
jgi:hypothetical protein